MSLPKPAIACAFGASGLGGTAVAGQRIGLGLTLALLLVLGSGLLVAGRKPSIPIAALAGALAAQPLLRDAGWVVAVDVVAAVAASAVTVAGSERWSDVRRALLAPLRPIGGVLLVTRSVEGLRPEAGGAPLAGVLRGTGLAMLLVTVFGALFATADSAFAGLLDEALPRDLDLPGLVWRLALALAFLGAAGAIARSGRRPAASGDHRSPWVPGRIELTIALGALVALFATFVAVQLRVLFGGAEYVQRTTGLGYGDYARQGFAHLLLAGALTLAVVAVAARRSDRAVRGLLGALCLLTLVVLLSAHHRLDLVEDAYGFTRVRYAGHAIVAWLAAMFGLVLAAGIRPAMAPRLPRVATTLTLAGVLAFSLSNPDGRIAQRAVDRAAAGRPVDAGYLAGLSADALPALERLPREQRDTVVPALLEGLARPDGLAGLNIARARAR